MRDMGSPGARTDLGEGGYGNNLRVPHQVRGKSHARVKLPRNHSSGRNLAKMGRQQMQQFEQQQLQQRHGRQRSHEGDTEIRLPGSLDESTPVASVRPLMRRNNTAFQLGTHQAHTKLKKNLSHGQLTRLGSGRNLAALGQGSQKPPPSPGLKGKSKRPKSADFGRLEVEKDLHEQEVEIARLMQEKREGPKKVGFAVGSSGDTSEGEDAPQMEGSGLEEGEWTEESASASPYSTRQNTANNSRRTSVVQEKPPEKKSILPPGLVMRAKEELKQAKEKEAKMQVQVELPTPEEAPQEDSNRQQDEESEDTDEEEQEDDEADPPSPRSQPQLGKHRSAAPTLEGAKQQPQPPKQQRSPLQAAKEHPNPTAQFLRRQSGQLPAPAMVSNVNAMDAQHSTRGSPTPSMHGSSTLNAAPGSQEDELVSRFIPSASHPTTGSAANTTSNTPKTTHFHTPVEDSTLASQHRPPISPGSSTVSAGSSAAATPAIGRSRIELRMLQEKAAADIESAAHRHPIIPAHVYDRRNESLKSYLNLAALGTDGGMQSTLGQQSMRNGFAPGPAASTTALSLGPEIFQGRFKAIHTELRVVQKFRDPLAESLARLQSCKGTKLSLRSSPQKQAAALRMSKSAVSLPATKTHAKRASQPPPTVAPTTSAAKFSTSASPPKTAASAGSPVKSALQNSKSSVQIQDQGKTRRTGQRGVSFAGTPPDVRESRDASDEVEDGPAMIAQRLWESVGS